MYEYRVESKWTALFGGWGMESDIAEILNNAASEGWRLVRTQRSWFNLLLIFERQKS